MGSLIIQKKKDIKEVFEDGLGRAPLSGGDFDHVHPYKCTLKAGQTWEVPVYPITEKVQIFYFTSGLGYVCTESWAYNITERGIFVPDYDNEKFALHATTQDLEFLHIVCDLTEYDKRRIQEIRIATPRFWPESECWRYEEGFKKKTVKSYNCINNRYFATYSMGAVVGKGPVEVGQHTHTDLAQWYYAFPGSSFTYDVDGKTVEVEEGDWLYIPNNISHGSHCPQGATLDYVWFEYKLGEYGP